MPAPFSVAAANRTLPLVSRIVRDILAAYPRWLERVSELELLAADVSAARPSPRAAALEHEAQAIARDIDACIRELADIGVEYKQPLDAGLVDFPGELDGRPIYLCWRYGEPAVEHWHEVDAGFAGRQPITPHALT